MRRLSLRVFLGCFILIFFENLAAAQILKISDNGRFFVYEDNEPFFYLGDTAWELFHRLDRDDAARYLSDRAAKGFTVIQAVIVSEIGGLGEPNAYGDFVFEAKDPSRPNEAYFELVDDIVDMAEKLELFIGMVPTWGSYWSSNNPERVIFTPGNAREFGRFLGSRYKDKPVIWILGGDQNINTVGEREIIDALARGLEEGDGGTHLMTFHPRGPGFSSDSVQDADWLDFNMYQSSHGAHDHDNGLFAEHDYALQPTRPTIDGEPRYEHIPVGFYFRPNTTRDRFDDDDCRQAAYWSLLAGAAGHTYGNNNIWQMWTPDREPRISASIPWYEALNHPGSFQMGLLKKLFESRPYQLLQPNQTIIKDGPTTGGAKIRAAVANDGSFAFIYSPRGEQFTIDKSAISGIKTNEIWFDPRYGNSYYIHSPETKGIQTYTPPTSGRGNDWVLIIENAELNFPVPGSPLRSRGEGASVTTGEIP